MKVPLLDLKPQYQSLKKEIDETLIGVAESQMLILGPEVQKLEKNLAEYCGSKYAVGVSSGTDALLMALMALDIKAGDEVILPTYSFFATAGVVARLGAIPVFIDSEPVTFNIDPHLIEKAITPKTRAIMPVHLFGQAANVEEIINLANKHNIPVIEDTAQSIGAMTVSGKPCGSLGLMGCYSFYPTKNLGAFGDGGLVVTNYEKLYEKLVQMRNHGMNPKYYHKFIGGNFRLDALQAAILNVKIPHLDSWHEARRKNAELYNKYFIESGLCSETGITEFDNNNKVLIPKAIFKNTGNKNYHIYNQYSVQVEKRDEMRQFLSENEIGSEIYYPVPFHRQECFSYLNYQDRAFPIANKLAECSIALPIFPELTEDQIKFVVETFKRFLK